jgi:hypothetical protein
MCESRLETVTSTQLTWILRTLVTMLCCGVLILVLLVTLR